MLKLLKTTVTLTALGAAAFAYAQTTQIEEAQPGQMPADAAPITDQVTEQITDQVIEQMPEEVQAATPVHSQGQAPAMPDQAKGDEMRAEKRPTIAKLASGSDDYSTLGTAIEAAELDDLLDGPGPYTVFAPGNSAFAALPEGKLNALLENQNKDKLAGLLAYHVIRGSVSAADLVELVEANDGYYKTDTLNGSVLKVVLADGDVYLIDANGGTARVSQADMEADNGVIHGIDQILMPVKKEAE